ncbi:hypothetical protein B0A58_02810 [Flavobacterium branchiophilum NBRC 15030 = ATCC 35035]|uniref:Lipoprotein n=1 Tax=Flavobacterium branchiophilum TaxID=55197 RepID=A0A543G299_9FLAO|nr:hypothetical protein [Flavobacterium branchiophilum]OXA80109.1 hypothetical protein B0A58_02810 [Flavobacterium branchiophilum NBRC 15030 = ATCC 35035]TQM40154.1 hypothetical protein BC670_1024 [Flavobacterium branchiophilum]GEM54931.1 hypothetical protein FB1_11520 [Flavobacterium branchiophilum NBRC 15030 = ATCC 35035]
MKMYFPLFGLFLLSCSSYNHSNYGFEIENCSNLNDTLVRKDGFYTEILEKGHTSVRELFFIGENVVKTNGSSYDNEYDRYTFYKNYKEVYKNEILKSKYCIVGKRIFAYANQSIIKDCIIHACSDLIYLNFEGEIKNKDSIVNWHLVPPFPKFNKKEMELNKDLFEPKTLIFVKSDAVKKLNNPQNQ